MRAWSTDAGVGSAGSTDAAALRRWPRVLDVFAWLWIGTLAACGSDRDSTVSPLRLELLEVCTFTQGYWKNHPEAWPVDTLALGTVSYDQEELLDIFDESVNGNGLVSLAHQLIAAKLNVALGSDDSSIASSIEAADVLIGSLIVPPIGSGWLATSATSSLVDALDDFNNRRDNPCNVPPPPVCGDGQLDDGEECDDGNTADGDGCSSTCGVEPPPPPACGDGELDDGEECDDGNTADGDGCSSTCCVEPPPPPVCGDGHLDDGEECDDGNTADGDGCSSTCCVEPPPPPVCGDGHLDDGEECDDGNTADGDGCDSECCDESHRH